jgi:hypothetical protein
MKSSTMLRITMVPALLMAAGHTYGEPWTPVKDGAAGVLLDSMKSLNLGEAGANRSYWEFYVGFGWANSVCLFAFVLLLWQLASLARHDVRRARPLMLSLGAGYAAFCAVCCKFFFIVPIALSGAAAVGIIAAWLLAGREVAAYGGSGVSDAA